MDQRSNITVESRGIDEATVDALGLLSEALEATEAARGHLYQFHRLTGTGDRTLGDAVAALRKAGHESCADQLETELLGRNVLAGRWTFQVVEEYDDGYYQLFKSLESDARAQLGGGVRHLKEAAMKEASRSRGLPGHEATPASPA